LLPFYKNNHGWKGLSSGATLLLLLFCHTMVLAQSKSEWGILAKAGVHGLPQKHSLTNLFESESLTETISAKAGQVYTLGAWYGLRLGGHVRLSGSLLFRQSIMENSRVFQWQGASAAPAINQSTSSEMQQFTEYSIVLPVQMRVSFRKNGRTALSLGAGFSRFLAGKQEMRSILDYPQFPQNNYSFYFPETAAKSSVSKSAINYSIGVSHRLDHRTSIGLEFTFEKRPPGTEVYPLNNLIDTQIACRCYGIPMLDLPNMQQIGLYIEHRLDNHAVSSK
jgi:hypothetical protein